MKTGVKLQLNERVRSEAGAAGCVQCSASAKYLGARTGWSLGQPQRLSGSALEAKLVSLPASAPGKPTGVGLSEGTSCLALPLMRGLEGTRGSPAAHLWPRVAQLCFSVIPDRRLPNSSLGCLYAYRYKMLPNTCPVSALPQLKPFASSPLRTVLSLQFSAMSWKLLSCLASLFCRLRISSLPFLPQDSLFLDIWVRRRFSYALGESEVTVKQNVICSGCVFQI